MVGRLATGRQISVADTREDSGCAFGPLTAHRGSGGGGFPRLPPRRSLERFLISLDSAVVVVPYFHFGGNVCPLDWRVLFRTCARARIGHEHVRAFQAATSTLPLIHIGSFATFAQVAVLLPSYPQPAAGPSRIAQQARRLCATLRVRCAGAPFPVLSQSCAAAESSVHTPQRRPTGLCEGTCITCVPLRFSHAHLRPSATHERETSVDESDSGSAL